MKTDSLQRRSGPPVTASVIAWNDRAHLVRCLAALKAQTHSPVRVIVVDNASVDGSADAAAEACPEAIIIRNDRNLGYAGAHNLAFARSKDPCFLVLNADVCLAPDYVARLVDALARDEGLGSVSGKLLRAEGAGGSGPEIDSAGIGMDWRGRFRDLHTGAPDAAGPSGGEVFGVCGAAAMYRRAAILDAVPAAGGGGRPFDSTFFAYYEDADLAWALRRRGWRSRVEGGAIAEVVETLPRAPLDELAKLEERQFAAGRTEQGQVLFARQVE
ncbi:MAG: glycosyltransferase family 2 protein, partial [Myxococcota bacterium]